MVQRRRHLGKRRGPNKRMEPAALVGVDQRERMVAAKSGLSSARRAICGGPFVKALTKANNLA